MSDESSAQPIKIGYLMDFLLPEGFPKTYFEDLTQPFDLVFKQAVEQGVIDRPIEIIYREVEGLPKGSVKAVIDAYGELCDEGCLAIFGPHITDNAVPTREAIEERFRVLLHQCDGFGRLARRVVLLVSAGFADRRAHLLVRPAGQGRARASRCARRAIAGGGELPEELSGSRSAQGDSDRRGGLDRADGPGRDVCGEHPVRSQGAGDRALWFRVRRGVHQSRAAGVGRDPPRFCGTAFQNAWLNPVMWNAFMGWTGVDQYDEGNMVGQKFLDEYNQAYGRRPEWCVPVVNRDVACTLLRALTDAHPLSPRGVKEALERVKMMPAASGAPGTRVSFGNWTRRAWMGAGYLVARRLDADGVNSHLVDRFGEE